ncbi:glutathione peroxidase [Prosthecomicrobium sp. N25]|uniref:glutathione peroxidase n=1 Tax=Prosthecomicrobium sp. N25 TaxID=3129254 RepID=UPI003077BF8A
MDLTRRRLVLASLCVPGATLWASAASAAGPDLQSGTAWRFAFEAADGGTLPLADHAGKVLLVVNTASRCAFTPQYKGLQALHERYAAKGLVVIGVPSNDFGGQEPGSNADILGFCGGTYGVTFPIAGKTVVRGPSAHPFYRWAATVLGPANEPRWNFHKYLVGRDGRLAAAFASHLDPENRAVTAAIEVALAGTAPS